MNESCFVLLMSENDSTMMSLKQAMFHSRAILRLPRFQVSSENLAVYVRYFTVFGDYFVMAIHFAGAFVAVTSLTSASWSATSEGQYFFVWCWRCVMQLSEWRRRERTLDWHRDTSPEWKLQLPAEHRRSVLLLIMWFGEQTTFVKQHVMFRDSASEIFVN